MKSRLFSWMAVMSLFTPLAAPLRVLAQPEQPQTNRNWHYTVRDLGTLGGAYSFGYGLNNLGVVSAELRPQARPISWPKPPSSGIKTSIWSAWAR